MYIGVVLFVSSLMILLMVRSVSVRFLKAILFSVLWKLMMMFGGVFFMLLSFNALIALRQVKSVFVIFMFFVSAMLRMISFRSSSFLLGTFRITSCFLGSCRGLGWSAGRGWWRGSWTGCCGSCW